VQTREETKAFYISSSPYSLLRNAVLLSSELKAVLTVHRLFVKQVRIAGRPKQRTVGDIRNGGDAETTAR
jgi:hypothetical protein